MTPLLLAALILSGIQSAKPFPPPSRLWAAQTSRTDISLAWERVPGAIRYRIYVLNGAATRLVGQPTASGDWYVQRITAYGVPLRYAIEAVSENGAVSERIAFNEVVPVDAPPAPLAPPATVSASASADGTVTVSWSAVPRATAYSITRAARTGGVRVICRLCPPTGRFVDSEPQPGTPLVYSVVAMSPSGPSRMGRSREVTATGSAAAAAGPVTSTPASGTIHTGPMPGSCLALGREGNVLVRLSDGTVKAYERVLFRRQGMHLAEHPQWTAVPGVNHVVAVATSGAHSLALRSDGTIVAWGLNGQGQLGTEEAIDRRFGRPLLKPAGTPSPVRDVSNAVAVAAGHEHSVALLADGSLRSWGYAAHGVQGSGSAAAPQDNHLAPGPVIGIDNAIQIAANGYFTFALLKDGTIRAWGNNMLLGGVRGALGTGSDEDTGTPLPVKGITNAVAVAAGSGVGAALLADGTVRAWGYGYGPPRAGRGRTRVSNEPVVIPGVRNGIAISPYMALLADGTVREFPDDWPWTTPPITHAVAVASDHVNRIALLEDGTLTAWGRKEFYPQGAITLGNLGAQTARECAAGKR